MVDQDRNIFVKERRNTTLSGPDSCSNLLSELTGRRLQLLPVHGNGYSESHCYAGALRPGTTFGESSPGVQICLGA